MSLFAGREELRGTSEFRFTVVFNTDFENRQVMEQLSQDTELKFPEEGASDLKLARSKAEVPGTKISKLQGVLAVPYL